MPKEKEEEKIAVRVGTGGRVVIPPQALRDKGIKEGDIVLLELKKAEVKEVKEVKE
jgi:bifunctional DNA-binding transcriptional regulator/antitoxin component of YhaV-PrlF toxin-antitoxin module